MKLGCLALEVIHGYVAAIMYPFGMWRREIVLCPRLGFPSRRVGIVKDGIDSLVPGDVRRSLISQKVLRSFDIAMAISGVKQKHDPNSSLLKALSSKTVRCFGNLRSTL